jgi:hypothetical protein
MEILFLILGIGVDSRVDSTLSQTGKKVDDLRLSKFANRPATRFGLVLGRVKNLSSHEEKEKIRVFAKDS